MAERKNIYRCMNGHRTVTVDRDKGVTPFMINCKASGCREVAMSSFYELDDMQQLLEPTHEWYEPDDDEKATLDRATADHVERGGLLMRPIS